MYGFYNPILTIKLFTEISTVGKNLLIPSAWLLVIPQPRSCCKRLLSIFLRWPAYSMSAKGWPLSRTAYLNACTNRFYLKAVLYLKKKWNICCGTITVWGAGVRREFRWTDYFQFICVMQSFNSAVRRVWGLCFTLQRESRGNYVHLLALCHFNILRLPTRRLLCLLPIISWPFYYSSSISSYLVGDRSPTMLSERAQEESYVGLSPQWLKHTTYNLYLADNG